MVVHIYYIALVSFAVLSCITLPLSILSCYWDIATIDRGMINDNLPSGYRLSTFAQDKFLLIIDENDKSDTDDNDEDVQSQWINNPHVMANTNSGLWSSCLSISELEYEEVVSNLSWVGPKCVDHEEWSDDGHGDSSFIPRWRKTMNLSISCFITALIIITAAMLLGIIGILYRQAACVLVDSVLFQLTVFFSLFGIAIHIYNRTERRRDLSCSPDFPTVCVGVSYNSGWSQILGVLSVIFSGGAAAGLYGLSRDIISRSW